VQKAAEKVVKSAAAAEKKSEKMAKLIGETKKASEQRFECPALL
jgi:hypothetical protein